MDQSMMLDGDDDDLAPTVLRRDESYIPMDEKDFDLEAQYPDPMGNLPLSIIADDANKENIPPVEDDDEEVKVGPARFSQPINIPSRITLNGAPLAFVDQALAQAEVEEDVSQDQALQYALFKRLPLKQEDWPTLIEAMAEEYRHTKRRSRGN